MAYFVTPRRYKVISTRSKPQLSDRVGLMIAVTNGPPGAVTKVFHSRAAYLGFVGNNQSVDLTEQMWGLHESWRMDIPSKGTVFIEIIAANYRTSGERALRELLLKVASMAAAFGGASALPAKLVEWAQQIGISEAVLRAATGTSIGGIVNQIADWISNAVLGPPNCDGEIFRSFLSISMDDLDKYLDDRDDQDGRPSPISSIEDGGTTIVTRVLHVVNNAFPIIPGAQCNSPVGELVLEFERQMPLLFDDTAIQERAIITGAPNARPSHVVGAWVNEDAFAGPLYQVEIIISMRDSESDYLTVHVIEKTSSVSGPRVFFEHTFENVEIRTRYQEAPKGPNVLGNPGNPGGPFPRIDFGESKVKTSLMILASGDLGDAEIRIWNTTAKHRETEIFSGMELQYRRNGLAHATPTRTWLSRRTSIR